MIPRDIYIKRITPLIGKPPVKVITGMRRAGKSFLLKLIRQELLDRGVDPVDIIMIDMESMDFSHLRTFEDLHRLVQDATAGRPGKAYVMIDEIQEIEGWERAVASWSGEPDRKDVYITGSNARLLSSELATLLSGRHVEIRVFPLGFAEFLAFRGADTADRRKVDDEFALFLRYGGLPGIHSLGNLLDDPVFPVLRSVNDTITLKDVMRRHQIRNPRLLENICRYVYDNIGNLLSARGLAAFLKNERSEATVDTVASYLSHFVEAHLFLRVPRYDIRGKAHMELVDKFYVSDLGLRHAFIGYRADAIGALLENVTLLELDRRGWSVTVGKQGVREVDFVAERGGERQYIQVCYQPGAAVTLQRELEPLRMIRDNYPKLLLSMDRLLPGDFSGVRHQHIIDFLLEEAFPGDGRGVGA